MAPFCGCLPRRPQPAVYTGVKTADPSQRGVALAGERAFNGRILNLHLGPQMAEPEPLPESIYRDFLGGYGLGARLLFDRVPRGADPLGPDNVLGFFPGLLTGSPLFGIRFQVAAKSPKNNGWGDANCGGDFGPLLKLAGWDAALLYGASALPIYIFIEDGQVQFLDASDIWGMLALDTEKELKRRHGRRASVACIGPAGEGQSLMAGIVNDNGRVAARSGLGAVMGSKRVKAVVVKASRIILSNSREVVQEQKDSIARFQPHVFGFWKTYGTAGMTATSAMSGDSAVRNWTGSGPHDFPEGLQLTGDAFNERMQKRYACWHCPIACGSQSKESADPRFPFPEGTHRPEYETTAGFGALALNADADSLVYLNHLCNEYGLDTISTSASVAFAIECFEHGLITKEDTDGLELRWGAAETIVRLVELIGRREGFGDVLADGVARASRLLGPETAPFAVAIAGEEVPMHDPRLNPDFLTTYKLDPTPARHTQYQSTARPGWGLPPRDKDRERAGGRGHHHKAASEYVHVINATGVCQFIAEAAPNERIPDWINLTTGWDMSAAEALQAGERIANLRLAFSAREGDIVTRREVPERVSDGRRLESGYHAGFKLDAETMEREYLEAADWEQASGKPRRRKLEQLGLGDVADDIEAP